MAIPNPFIVAPGKAKDFIYVGEMIPNQVIVKNLSTALSAEFTITSGVKSWTYYQALRKNGAASVLVRWPSGRARIANISSANASIEVAGNGIFPAYDKAKIVKKVVKAIKKKK